MANTYNWVISALEAYPEHEGNQNVVFTIHWRRTADDGNGHTADVYSTQQITYEAGTPFTPYASLTQVQVEGWLESAMGEEQVAAINAALDKQIESQINPPVATLAPPWGTAAE